VVSVAEERDEGSRLAGATDADRHAATQRLITACAEGRLTLSVFEERVEAVLAASTATDLAAATHDLPALAVDTPPAHRADKRRWSMSLVGGLHRRGGWQIPKHLIHFSLIGRTSLDLGHAELSAAETTITLVSFLGGADLRVPRAVRSDLTGVTVFGARHMTGSPTALRDGPVVHVRVFSLVGGATVRPTGSRWGRFSLLR
jgi:hypothetical protein